MNATSTPSAGAAPPPAGRDLMTPAEVMGYCRIGRTTLWRWTAEEGLKTVSVRGIKRFRRRDLDDFIERHAK